MTGPTVLQADFSGPDSPPRTVVVPGVLGKPEGQASALPCASLLKPVIAWLVADRLPLDTWTRLARPMVTVSANPPMDHIWQEIGPEHVRDQLASVGITTSYGNQERSWGGLCVNAHDVCRGYQALLRADAAGDTAAAAVLTWMEQTSDAQTFGTRPLLTSAGAERVAIKAGWDRWPNERLARTHLTVLVQQGGVWRGLAVLTALPYGRLWLADYEQRVASGEPVLSCHEALLGQSLRAVVARWLGESSAA